MPNVTDVKVELIRDLATIDAQALGNPSSLFDRIDWFRRTREHCSPGGRPLVACATHGAASAWLFLTVTGRGRAVGLASWYTLNFAPVFGGPVDPATRHELLVAMARRLRGRTRSIALDHVSPPIAAQLEQAFGEAGWSVYRTAQTANWTVDVAGQSFAQYWTQRPGQLRSTAKRKAAKARLDIVVFDRFDAGAWAEYAAIYADSWKPDEGSLDFLLAMAETEGARGTLRLGIARREGVAIAAQLWTIEHGHAIIHKLAHRSGYDAWSPGTLLSKAMFEYVISSDHARIIDFGTGDDPYKRDWMTTCTMLERIELHDATSLSGFIGSLRIWGALLVARFRTR